MWTRGAAVDLTIPALLTLGILLVIGAGSCATNWCSARYRTSCPPTPA